MLFLKACPKCHGDMANNQADPGERACLQCGYLTYPTPPLPFVRERSGQSSRPRKAKQVA